MKQENKQKSTAAKLVGAYLVLHLKTIIAFLLFLLIVCTVYFLYRLEPEPFLYAALLVAVIGAVYGVYDFWRFTLKHTMLHEALPGITMGLDHLPDADGLLETDYQELIVALYQEKTELVSQADTNRTEMLDYYTLWAHQIKTPISAMRVLLQSEEELSRDKLEQELFYIEQYAEMVLQFLRMESMSADLLLKSYQMNELIRQAVKKYAIVFIHKKISLQLDDLDMAVVTDEKWLVFVIEQLLSNALKYTPRGSIHIYASQEHTLVIEDTGIGIREEDIPRIFEKGFTGYNGRMDKKSTGIGLYLCRKILTKLSHTITITSCPGKGTRVIIGFQTEKLDLT